MAEKAKVLEVRNLCTDFLADEGTARAVDGVSFDLYEGETLGIVGESGSGKSVTALSLMRLIPEPPGKLHRTSRILVLGQEVLKLSEREMQKFRGSEIAMIFQDAMAALNPVFTIQNLLEEVLLRHRDYPNGEVRERMVELLSLVRIAEPEKRLEDYPHQMSGGMRQRVMIAMALSCNPKILIADEPTTALDVTIQAEILALISRLQQEIGMATLFITHDLAVVAETCKRVLVMYAGRIVEEAPIEDIFDHPLHPYTRGLIDSIPKMGQNGNGPLKAIPGVVPDIFDLPKGCRFRDRCFRAEPKCSEENPELVQVSEDRRVACFFPLDPVAL